MSPLEIPEVRVMRLARHEDARGFLSETYSQRALAAVGITDVFVQDNHSLSRERGTVRGLHFQIPPVAQAKLIRVLRGAILDVAVDLRHGSPTFGRHASCELNAAGWELLYVPEGFAHGFCSLEEHTEVLYKCSAHHAPESERGLRWDDPALGIDWPVTSDRAVLSERDRAHPRLAELPRFFTWVDPGGGER